MTKTNIIEQSWGMILSRFGVNWDLWKVVKLEAHAKTFGHDSFLKHMLYRVSQKNVSLSQNNVFWDTQYQIWSKYKFWVFYVICCRTEWVPWCAVRLPKSAKAFGQELHLNGFPPCVLWCLIRIPARAKAFGQDLHLYSFTPECVLWCIVSVPDSV